MTNTGAALLNSNVAWKWDVRLISGGGDDLIGAAFADVTADASLRLFLQSGEWGAQTDETRYLSDTG